MTKLLALILTASGLTGCLNSDDKKPDPNFYANREAPVGWVKFTTYPDGTFEYCGGRVAPNTGTFKCKGDTLYLTSADTSFEIDKAVISEKYVKFVNSQDSNYHNGALIDFNKLTK